MTDWYSARKLAGVSGLPGTRAIQIRAKRESWVSRPRKAQGGGLEYHISTLPADARVALAQRTINDIQTRGDATVACVAHNHEVAGSTPAPATIHSTIHLSGAKKRRAEARLAIVNACDIFIHRAHLAAGAGTEAFARLYNQGQAAVSPDFYAEVKQLHPNSIRNWRNAIAREGIAGLAGKHGRHRKGRGIIDTTPAISEYIIAQLAAKPHIDGKQMMRGLRARFRDSDIELPGYRTVQRYMTRWKDDNAGLFLAVTDPDAHRSRLAAAFGSQSENITALNQVWELDSTPVDALTSDGRRQAIVGLIDVYSRRAMVLVTPTSMAIAITTLMRRAIMSWGMPQVIKTDNGSDYVSMHMQRAVHDLKIQQILCPPYTPEGKPHVERFLGRLSHQFIEMLPGYIGHSVADRKAIENRKSFAQRREENTPFDVSLSPDELQAALDDWCVGIYARDVHRTLGISPFEKAAGWTGPVRCIADERALDLLLAEAPGGDGLRTITKNGIRLDNATFIHGALGVHVGENVHVRYDPADLGRIMVYTLDSEFICIAECPERTGLDRKAAAKMAKAKQNKVLAQAKGELRRIKNRIKPETMADELRAQARDAAGNVVALPHRAEDHTTEALTAASRAADEAAGIMPDPVPLTAAEKVIEARILENLAAPEPETEEEKAYARYRKAQGIEACLKTGTRCDQDELNWLPGYQASNEYRTHKKMEEMFGPAAFSPDE